MTISAQILEKIRKQIFDRRKISSIISSGHREAFLINLQKNDKKLKLCWMFEKLYLSEKFLEIHVFPQKLPLEALSHVLITLLTIFAKSLFFPQIFLKKFNPPPPHSKKNYQTEHFSRNFFSWRSLYGQINTQFWHFVFNVQKTSAECLEEVKKSWRHWFNQKKTVYLKKTLQTLESSFDNHAETFQKNYVNLLLIFTKTDCSISEKIFPIAYNFSGKKISMKKLL